MIDLITVDDREVMQHPSIAKRLISPTVVSRLSAADFAFMNVHDQLVGIERCEINNFIQKIYSGELESQLRKAEMIYHKMYLLLEGVFDNHEGYLSVYKKSPKGYFSSRISKATRYESILAMEIRLIEMGVHIIHTPNFECSMLMVQILFNQEKKLESEHTLFHKIQAPQIPKKLSDNPAVPRLMSLVPRLSENTAVTLINKYKTIWGILAISEVELLQIPGFGKTLIHRLKENLGLC